MAYLNGRIPSIATTETYLYYPGTTNGRRLLRTCAARAEAMATAFYLEFGRPLYATDGYRGIDDQWTLYRRYLNGTGAPAAYPGTSNHGWGRALDLSSNVNSFGSAEHKWMRENAGKYGFAHPYWARQGGGREEAWHWEDVGGGKSTPRVERPRGATVGLGHRGAKVREIQEQLKAAGHNIRVDGDFGLGTGIEVLRYQKKHGLTQNGKVGKATRDSLAGKRPSSTPSKPAPAPGTREFLKGRVERIQRAVHAKDDGVWGSDTDKRLGALRAASVYGGGRFPFTVEFTQRVVGVTPDGDWGSKSAAAHTAAVKRIQAVLGIEDDGVYGKKTQDALNALESKVRS